MAESAVLLIDDIYPEQLVRQWVLIFSISVARRRVLNRARFSSPGGAQCGSLPVDDPLKGNETGVYLNYTCMREFPGLKKG